MSAPRLYHDLAALWPKLSPPEDYAAEAELIDMLLRGRYPVADGRRPHLLELGAGGGHTLVHLADDYDLTAVDISDAMLDHCRALVPSATCIVGDMRTVRLGRTFDAVLIHDAIDYMLSEADVRAALETAAAHLEPGGVAMIAPTTTHETFIDGEVADDCETGDPNLAYFSFVHDPDPDDDTYEMILVYLIRDPRSRRVEVVEDRHICGLFRTRQWMAWMKDAGFDVRFVDEEDGPWSLFLGIRR
jgi:SAM-dependent methyltransferase